jgi:hypothetical protein
VTDCADAVAANDRDMNGQLKRCTGANYSTTTRYDFSTVCMVVGWMGAEDQA